MVRFGYIYKFVFTQVFGNVSNIISFPPIVPYLSVTTVNRIVEMDNDYTIPHILRDNQIDLVVVSILKSFFDVDASVCVRVEQDPIVLHQDWVQCGQDAVD